MHVITGGVYYALRAASLSWREGGGKGGWGGVGCCVPLGISNMEIIKQVVTESNG